MSTSQEFRSDDLNISVKNIHFIMDDGTFYAVEFAKILIYKGV